MSEPFTFDVVRLCSNFKEWRCLIDFPQAYSTTFEQIERLRELMVSFLNSERREFLPQFDVLVVGTPFYT